MDEAGDNFTGRSRLRGLAATAAFLTLLGVPGVFHLAYGVRGSDLRRWAEWLRAKPAAEAMRQIDGDFDRRFLLRRMAVQMMERVPAFELRPEGRAVQFGVDGFAFASEDSRVCMAAGFTNPRFPRAGVAARRIVELDAQLKRIGVHLLVVPVPAKASIYPDKLDPHYDPTAGPLLNVGHAAWFEGLRRDGVDVLDVTDLLWAHRNDPEGSMFLKGDSHWTDRAKRLVARAVAERVGPLVRGEAAVTFERRTVRHTVFGDLHDLLSGHPPAPAVQESVVALYGGDERPLVPGDDAPVVVIGDSAAALGVEEGYGLSQRVMEELGVGVQSLALIGANGDGMRLALARHGGTIPGRKVVVFAFSLRHVLLTDWKAVSIETPVR